MKPDSGRTIPLYFKVSPEEKARIDEKMEQLGIHNRRAYLRKMAVDGYAVRVDMADFKALVSLLRREQHRQPLRRGCSRFAKPVR